MKNSNPLHLVVLFLLYQSFNVQGQGINFDCHTEYNSSVFDSKSYQYCNDPNSHLSNYALDKRGNALYDQTPIYTINVKVHVIQYSLNDPRNYTTIDSAYIRQGIEDLNPNYSELHLPSIPASPPIPQAEEESDTRIRFKVHSVDFIQDTLGWAEISDMTPVSCNFKIINTNVIRIYNLPASVISSLTNNRSCIKITNSLTNDGSYMYSTRAYSAHPQDSIDVTVLSAFSNINDQTGILSVRGSIDRRFFSYNKYHQNDTNFLHIYFVRNTSECYMNGFGEAKSIPANALRMVNPGNSEIHLSGAWEVNSGGLLAHEIGHCLGSYHTMEYQHQLPPYINDVFQPDNNIGWYTCNDSTISNNIMGYNTCRNYLSPRQIADMRRVINNESIIRNTVIENRESTNNDVIISEPNTIWEKHEIVGSSLIIESGASLTIKCRVHFSPEGQVIVKQGGKLILDGGTLTNEQGQFWQGIQVYGTTNKNQFPESNPTYQGLLIVKNGGIIENANKAVTNWKQDDFNAVGGVIQVSNGVFRNNRRDVEFISYQNHNPSNGNNYRDLSKFTNTDFVTDDNFIELGLSVQTHVTMWEVDGIVFTNCHFTNDITTNKNNSSAPNRGIYSIDAGYKVVAGCSSVPPIGQQCPTANIQKSSFKGLGTGIEASGAGTTRTITVQQSDFEDNVWGIVTDELDNASLNRNIMDVGDAGYTLYWPIGAGIMTSNSTGYIIEENNISTNLTGGVRVGINISNSGTDDNRVYKNKLTDLDIATGGSGLNHNSNYQSGLQFLCNEFKNNGTAISLGSNITNDGARLYQGNFKPKKPAGNTFQGNTLDIDNTANSIIYFHNWGNTEPMNYQGLVSLQDTTISNSCPSSFSGGIVMQPIQFLIDSLTIGLNGYSTAYNDLNFAYQSLIDDGNTDEFKDNIELNWSYDAWLLRAKLLAKSPYLSSEVLLMAASQNILPNGMLLEVLLANPDATKGERFIGKLKEATNNSFPEYMLDYVRGNYNSRTLRTNMEGQLSAIHTDLSNTRNWIKNLTKSKEEYTNLERFDIAKMGDEVYNKVGLMDYYIERGNFNQADSVLNVIENDKRYAEDLALIDNFSDYINFRSSIENRNLSQLDSSEISYLQTLAENKGRVAGYAQNILCFFYNICYEKDFAFGEPQAKAMMMPTKNNQAELNNVLYNVNLYPNPAKDYTSLQWEIYDELKDAQYSVVDLNGRVLLNGVLSGNKGEQVIDTRKLGQGIYIIGIYNNSQMKVNRKLIVEGEK